MAVLTITNNLVYNVELLSDLTSLGSDDGITVDTVAWVEESNSWFWPDTISASTSTWTCGDLSGTRSWSFQTNTTTGYAGGFYDFAGSASDFNSVSFGTVNAARAAHLLIVTGAVPGSTTTIQVTGTSITDAGVRTPSDTENLVVVASTAIDSYFETTKKWNGQVTINRLSGTAIFCNYGWAKYHDSQNLNFVVLGFECLWDSDSTDSTSDIELRHHTDTGWTYNFGAPPVPPTAIASRSGDYIAENTQQVGEGAWKRSNLGLAVTGSGVGGILFEVTSGSTGGGALSFRQMSLEVSLRIS